MNSEFSFPFLNTTLVSEVGLIVSSVSQSVLWWWPLTQQARWQCQVLVGSFNQVPRFLVARTYCHHNLRPPKSVLILSCYLFWLLWKDFFELHLRLVWSTSYILKDKNMFPRIYSQEYVHTKYPRYKETYTYMSGVQFGSSNHSVQSLKKMRGAGPAYQLTDLALFSMLKIAWEMKT